MKRGPRRRRWIDLLVAVLLIALVPACSSWAFLGDDTVSSPSDPDADDEDGEEGAPRELQGSVEDHTRARARAPAPPPAEVATAPRQRPVTHRAPTLLASVAPKSHPSRLSVRRQH